MEASHVKGLLGSVGRAIARLPASEHALARLKGVRSRGEFRSFLESVDLGIAPPASRGLIDAVTGEDWRDFHGQLVLAADVAYHNFRSPAA